MFKLRIGYYLHQHKLYIRSAASIIKTQNLSSCSKAAYTSLPNHHLLKSSSPVLLPSRTFWETFPSSSRSFNAKDGLDKDNYELVYRNRIFNYAFYGQLVSELTLMVQTAYALYHSLNFFLVGKTIPVLTQVGSYTITYDMVTFAAITLFTIQNACVFVAAQKALLRVYHKKDTDEYVFISLGVNPFKTRKVICKPGELECMYLTDLTAMIRGNFQTPNNRYFLRHEHFKTNYHYNRLLQGDC